MNTRQIPVNAIVAVDRGGLIGANGQLPWRLPDDLKNFKRVTEGSTVIMGRRNWESLPEQFRPLPNRFNIVMSGAGVLKEEDAQVSVCRSAADALSVAKERGSPIFVIGGAGAYEAFSNKVTTWYVTEVDTQLKGDIYIPHFWHRNFKCVEEVKHPADAKHIFAFTMSKYIRIGG